MDDSTVGLIGSQIFILVLLAVLVVLSVRVVREHERMVVFRLGRSSPDLVREPGLRFIIPLIDRPVRVDMREQVVEVASRSSVTRDGQTVDVGARITYRTVDALAMVLAVADARESLAVRAAAILGELVAQSDREDVRFRRQALTEALQGHLEEEAEGWGVTVTEVALA